MAERNSIKAVEAPREKLTRLLRHLDNLTDRRFTGYVKVNYTQGSIARIEQFEEILGK